MRIIAGSAKGRKLVSPEGDTARPTSDRAREALFSSLESEFNNMEGIRFLDLFAGSGAVTAEAISRGASSCTLVDSDRLSMEIARKNVEIARSSLQSVKSVEVNFIDDDAETFVKRKSNPFDVIFIDPPYAYPDLELMEMVTRLLENGYIAPSTLVVIERASRVSVFPWPDSMREVKVRRYGNAAIFYGEVAKG